MTDPLIAQCPGTSAFGCSSAIDLAKVSHCSKCRRVIRGRARPPQDAGRRTAAAATQEARG